MTKDMKRACGSMVILVAIALIAIGLTLSAVKDGEVNAALAPPPALMPAVVGASPSNMHVVLGKRTLLKYEQLTDLSGPFTLAPPPGADEVEIQAEGQNLRYRGDGGAVTGAVGMLLIENQARVLESNLSEIQVMEAAVGGIANVFWWDTN